MSDNILGYDADKKPLREGDRVEVVYVRTFSDQWASGKKGNITGFYGYHSVFGERVRTDIPDENLFYAPGTIAPPASFLRLINSGQDLFEKCKEQADSMPRESKVLEAMPWTEPEP